MAAELRSAETGERFVTIKRCLFLARGTSSDLLKETVSSCDAVIVEAIRSRYCGSARGTTSFYRWANIPGGMYSGNPNDIKTLEVGATFVTSTRTLKRLSSIKSKQPSHNFDSPKNSIPHSVI
ncbi:MAG: hypothetical protein CM15mP88_0670 [Pseudomonadota bacterium]|nr:MAG: hypothetical protein CM15mP88_0670 [Pseudomonadota bacterium]